MPSECVEVASISGYVLIRDSSWREADRVLTFTRDQWLAFIRQLADKGEQPLKTVAIQLGISTGNCPILGLLKDCTGEAVRA